MKKNGHPQQTSVQLPEAFLPVLAGNADQFIVRMEGEQIILTPKKPGAKVGLYKGPDRRANGHPKTFAKAERMAAERAKKETRDKAASILATQATVRPKFCYHAKDKRMTPDTAGRYGLSPTRLRVYRAIYGAKKGLLAKDIMTKLKMPHGSVQQTLNWLRNQRLVSHEIIAPPTTK